MIMCKPPEKNIGSCKFHELENRIDQALLCAVGSKNLSDFLSFIELAARVTEETTQVLLSSHSEWLAFRKELAPRYADYVRNREIQHTQHLIANKCATHTDDFADRTYARVRDMFEQIDFARYNNFVMVGCGPFPATILHAINRTPLLHCLGLDTDQQAVDLCQKLIETCHLPRFQVDLKDGRDHDFSTASVVYIANLTTPKREILARVSATAQPGTPVILRDPFALGVLIAEPGAERLDNALRVTAKGIPEPQFLSRHIFLETTPHRDMRY